MTYVEVATFGFSGIEQFSIRDFDPQARIAKATPGRRITKMLGSDRVRFRCAILTQFVKMSGVTQRVQLIRVARHPGEQSLRDFSVHHDRIDALCSPKYCKRYQFISAAMTKVEVLITSGSDCAISSLYVLVKRLARSAIVCESR